MPSDSDALKKWAKKKASGEVDEELEEADPKKDKPKKGGLLAWMKAKKAAAEE